MKKVFLHLDIDFMYMVQKTCFEYNNPYFKRKTEQKKGNNSSQTIAQKTILTHGTQEIFNIP